MTPARAVVPCSGEIVTGRGLHGPYTGGQAPDARPVRPAHVANGQGFCECCGVPWPCRAAAGEETDR